MCDIAVSCPWFSPLWAPLGVPRHLDTVQIREDLLKLEDVQSVDELNVWALTADKTAALVHLQLSESLQCSMQLFMLFLAGVHVKMLVWFSNEHQRLLFGVHFFPYFYQPQLKKTFFSQLLIVVKSKEPSTL